METIVVVDDFQAARKVVARTLAKNYQVLEAADGMEALELFDGQKIDLLITDFNMPKMDGAELVTEVRKIEEYKYIPILILSTEVNEEKKGKAMKAQITDTKTL